MASSLYTNGNNDCREPSEEEVEGGGGGADGEVRLELGLGLSQGLTKSEPRSSSVAASSSCQSIHELGLGLGLSSGFVCDNEAVRNNSGSLCAAQPSNHRGLLHHIDHMPSLTTPHIGSVSNGLLHRDHHQMEVSKRTEIGLWFSLRSSIDREGDTLPQIPKAYIRVKDENVTVFLVKKYLVGKLGLTNEAEIDISCMGQKLLDSQTLKYVRDVVWFPKLLDSLNAIAAIGNEQETSINHLLPLHYGKSCFYD